MKAAPVLRLPFFLAALVCSARFALAAETALDRYIAKPDPSYEYHLVNSSDLPGGKLFVVEMTSQTWRTTNEVDRVQWKHWLIITKPDEVKWDKALLFISGGGNDSPAPTTPDGNLARIAAETHSVVVELKDVPNQPLTFAGETTSRHEDAFIAYTWDKFLRTGDETWPARLPMTKAAVRAMDAIQDFCKSDAFGKITINNFVVAGGSKRGWTTWTTAAVDKRVIGIIPIVIDLLNIVPSFKHHYQAYGFWAPAVQDYVDMGIMDWMDTPQYKALMKIEEPYEYRDRLTMPKFLVNAADDQFFLPDSSQFYFNDLPGVKYIRYVPNADHSLKGSDAPKSLFVYYQAMLDGGKLPAFSWKTEGTDTLVVNSADQPQKVLLWKATNPKARDFRLETVGKEAWTSSPLNGSGAGDLSYSAKVDAPPEGWTAFFIELSYPGRGGVPFKFTTQVRVVPDKLPSPPPVAHGH
jgi:PhoPQ-activated pathogenicity-related protein